MTDLTKSPHENFADVINELNPGDVGFETRGNLVLKYEGFTDACWEDQVDKLGSDRAVDHAIPQLETEILDGWAKALPGYKCVEHDWTDEPFCWAETVFWAVFEKDTK